MQLFIEVPGRSGSASVELSPAATLHDAFIALQQRLHSLRCVDVTKSNLRLQHHGKPLPWHCVLSNLSLPHGARLELLGSLRGGGGDGGSTGAESRSSYLEMYKQKQSDKVDPLQTRRAKWTCCSISGKPLQSPVVADEYGSLFNKVEMLLALKGRKAGEPWPSNLSHITRLKDLIAVSPTWNNNYRSDAGHDAERPASDAPFECPVSGVPLNGTYKSLLHRATGILVSEKSVRQAPDAVQGLITEAAASALEGHKAAEREELIQVVDAKGAWQEGDWVIVNPEGSDAEAAQHRVDLAVARRSKKKVSPNAATKKRDQPPAAPSGVKRMKTGILDSLFHEDGEGARVEETYLCRSVGARGMNLT